MQKGQQSTQNSFRRDIYLKEVKDKRKSWKLGPLKSTAAVQMRRILRREVLSSSIIRSRSTKLILLFLSLATSISKTMIFPFLKNEPVYYKYCH